MYKDTDVDFVPSFYCTVTHSTMSPYIREKYIYHLCILFCVENIENMVTYMVLQVTASVSLTPN